MRRRGLILIAALAAGMILLTACTSSENTDMQDAVAASGGSQNTDGSQNIDGSQNTGGDTAAGTADASVVQGDDSQAAEGVAAAPVDDSVSDFAADIDTTAGEDIPSGEPAFDSEDNSSDSAGDDEAIPGEFDGVYQADGDDSADSDGTGADTGDIWTGTYANDEESITINYLDADTISFSFAQSGISGKAAVKGSQAVYNGDDHHVVVFNIYNDTVDVSVSSEEDYDASGSPLIGTYIKDYVSDTSAAE